MGSAERGGGGEGLEDDDRALADEGDAQLHRHGLPPGGSATLLGEALVHLDRLGGALVFELDLEPLAAGAEAMLDDGVGGEHLDEHSVLHEGEGHVGKLRSVEAAQRRRAIPQLLVARGKLFDALERNVAERAHAVCRRRGRGVLGQLRGPGLGLVLVAVNLEGARVLGGVGPFADQELAHHGGLCPLGPHPLVYLCHSAGAEFGGHLSVHSCALKTKGLRLRGSGGRRRPGGCGRTKR